MKIFNKYPGLKKQIDLLFLTRRDEILQFMIENDAEYKKIRSERTEASIALKSSLVGTAEDDLFEKYADAIFEQEIYELDNLYKQAVCDTLELLTECGII